MEMRGFLLTFALIVILGSCSSKPENESTEVKSLKMLAQVLKKSQQPKSFFDTRTLLTREQIDASKTPVLFVELESGQNGSLTPYPGQGIGQTWLGADGATITLDRGVLKATRGMGDDLMGSSSSMPPWTDIGLSATTYKRKLSHITGNNKIKERVFDCTIQGNIKKEFIEIWKLEFYVTQINENCDHNGFIYRNTYYLDERKIVRRSTQYHSDTIGYITVERLDR